MKIRRIALIGLSLAGVAMTQGCASVSTGTFVPNRSTVANRSMTSYFDATRPYRMQTTPMSPMRTVKDKSDVRDFRYY